MSVLKICAESKTWLTEVERIDLVSRFHIDPGKTLYDVTDTMFRGMNIMLTDFPDPKDEPIPGNFIDVHFKDKTTQYWVVPANSCFLMSDEGKTIDHF